MFEPAWIGKNHLTLPENVVNLDIPTLHETENRLIHEDQARTLGHERE